MESRQSLLPTMQADAKVQRIWDLTKIGNFDMDSWRTILSNLNEKELANVALVCKDFQLMAENIFDNRHNRRDGKMHVIALSFTNTNWKSIISRFGKLISNVMVYFPPSTDAVRQEDFDYFQHFLGDTVKSICFDCFDAKKWEGIVYRRRFERVENLSFVRSDLRSRCSLLHSFSYWYPNLKSLAFSNVSIGKNTFIEQSMPSVQNLTFTQVKSFSSDYLLVSIIKNPHLKQLSVDLNNFPLDTNMSCLPIVNEVLTNLESLLWTCRDMSILPIFRKSFVNLKRLTFSFMSNETSYKNELQKIVGYFPVLEVLKVTLIPQLLMTNDDLIDLLTHGSSTLKEITFTSKSICHDLELKFGYDFHRRVCQATANRSDVDIIIEFFITGFAYHITKEWIKKNGQLIVLKDSRVI